MASQPGFREPGSLGDDWPPYIAQVTYAETNTSAQAQTHRNTTGILLTAEVRHQYNNPAIEEVWAVIYPPDYTPLTDGGVNEGDGALNAETLPTVVFAPDSADDTALFTATADLTETGVYRIVVHARDQDGLYAQPVTVAVDMGVRVFLPVVSR